MREVSLKTGGSMRFHLALAFAAVLLASTPGRAADWPLEYLIHIKLVEASAAGSSKLKILAEPTLAVVAGREAYFSLGGEVNLRGESVDSIGTRVRLRVTPQEGERVQLKAKVQVSQLVSQSEDSTFTSGVEINVNRSI